MSKIYDTQADIVAKLSSSAFFQNSGKPIPVWSQRKDNLQQDLNIRLAQTGGLAVVVMLPKWKNIGSTVAPIARIILQLRFAVVISENPKVNQPPDGYPDAAPAWPGLNVPAEDVMEEATKLLHGKQNPTAPRSSYKGTLYNVTDAQMMEPTKTLPSALNYLVSLTTEVFP